MLIYINRLKTLVQDIPVYEVGEFVGVPIDDHVRNKMGPWYLPAIVYHVSCHNQDSMVYKVCCIHGPLARSYRGHELQDCRHIRFDELDGVDLEAITEDTLKLSMADALALNRTHWAPQARKGCNCRWGCKTETCQCRADNMKCTDDCHLRLGEPCHNEHVRNRNKPKMKRVSRGKNCKITKHTALRPITRSLTRRETRSSVSRR